MAKLRIKPHTNGHAKPQCSGCLFYVPDEGENPKQGSCRARAPQYMPYIPTMLIDGKPMQSPVSGFPPVRAELWCGDYKAK